ncbi:MAG: hypothetical protein HON43_03330 [Alphaproteobacteria bacterium]|nr:hypothetical protein [Alphaproteobacteria bacterium]MBT5389812.1 hypothetical protein [Alphaproteobacteria bacterium]MBT5540224.1 hypothetical protein [Alphaproteobacteria bacterium]
MSVWFSCTDPSLLDKQKTDSGYVFINAGEPIETPIGKYLHVPTEKLAAAVLKELKAATVHREELKFTKYILTAIDHVEIRKDEIIRDLLAHTEVLAYWAIEPKGLAEREKKLWRPLLAWVEKEFCVKIKTTHDMAPIQQSQVTLKALEAYLKSCNSYLLAVINDGAQLTGSLFVSVALCNGYMNGSKAFQVAFVEEVFQNFQWGEDEESKEKQKEMEIDLQTVEQFVGLLT